ncbi:hypothetical protein [Geodermatophilus sp. SYSU D00710]
MDPRTASPWTALLGGDPLPWLLASDDPAARWLTLTAVLGRPPADPRVRAAHDASLTDPATGELLDRLPDWEAGEQFSGDDNPRFAPNWLVLLADRGVGAGDDPRVEHLLDRMLAHQEDSGRFPSYTALRRGEPPAWGALLCDSHAVTEVLVRFGRGEDPRVHRALDRMGRDLTDTPQGRAWPCLPHSATGWRGPGRVRDCCPMVTLQALRTFGRVPARLRPPGLLDVARVPLHVWRVRGEEQPHVFGHGRRFKAGTWPPTWYGALTVLDALAGYPALWRGVPAADPDRRALAELLACLVAYAVGDDGRVTPRSVHRGLAFLSAGQKREPSAFATARVLATLTVYDGLAAAAAAVDVTALTSSRGGTGTAVPPPPAREPPRRPARPPGGGQEASATSRTTRAGSSSR